MNFLRKLSGANGPTRRHAPLESSLGAEASSPHSHFSIDDAFDIPEDDVEANILGGGQRGNGGQLQRAFVAASGGTRANGGRRHLSSSGSGAGEVIPEEEDEEEETPIIK